MAKTLAKSPTGIVGLDRITAGGLPRGRSTLICGGPGSGKTLFGIEFLARGALQFGEPGVLVSFEERPEELAENVASLGFDLKKLQREGKLIIDYIRVDKSEIQETGEYDLEGLFIRLGEAIRTIKAKRVTLDTIEALFSGFSNPSILRAELRRLFDWLKDRGVTTVITGERGNESLTRQGLEEYVSDCVIVLDHRVVDQISTRRLRVVKYRGSIHGTNEFPFLIDKDGISVLPITSVGLDYPVSNERVSSGIAGLDEMLGGRGYFRGSTILVSGTAGTGKTTVAAHFADAVCRSGERCMYLSFEESPLQLERNMRSVGIDLQSHLRSGRLRFQAVRSTVYGLETHLVAIRRWLDEFDPSAVVIDPMTTLLGIGSRAEVQAMLTRLIDMFKERQTTAMLISLTGAGGEDELTPVNISSLADTWLLLREIESNGERNRGIFLLKSRGMAHSNQVREFLITDRGVELVDAYTGPEGVLMGSARLSQEAKDRAEAQALQQEIAELGAQLESKRAAFELERARLEKAIAAASFKQKAREEDRSRMAQARGARSVAPRRHGRRALDAGRAP